MQVPCGACLSPVAFLARGSLPRRSVASAPSVGHATRSALSPLPSLSGLVCQRRLVVRRPASQKTAGPPARRLRGPRRGWPCPRPRAGRFRARGGSRRLLTHRSARSLVFPPPRARLLPPPPASRSVTQGHAEQLRRSRANRRVLTIVVVREAAASNFDQSECLLRRQPFCLRGSVRLAPLPLQCVSRVRH